MPACRPASNTALRCFLSDEEFWMYAINLCSSYSVFALKERCHYDTASTERRGKLCHVMALRIGAVLYCGVVILATEQSLPKGEMVIAPQQSIEPISHNYADFLRCQLHDHCSIRMIHRASLSSV